jgi:hypothetical protein
VRVEDGGHFYPVFSRDVVHHHIDPSMDGRDTNAPAALMPLHRQWSNKQYCRLHQFSLHTGSDESCIPRSSWVTTGFSFSLRKRDEQGPATKDRSQRIHETTDCSEGKETPLHSPNHQ